MKTQLIQHCDLSVYEINFNTGETFRNYINLDAAYNCIIANGGTIREFNRAIFVNY